MALEAAPQDSQPVPMALEEAPSPKPQPIATDEFPFVVELPIATDESPIVVEAPIATDPAPFEAAYAPSATPNKPVPLAISPITTE